MLAKQRGSKLKEIWDTLRSSKRELDARDLARMTEVSRRYINTYLRALTDAGYLIASRRYSFGTANPHDPLRYTIGPYKGELAPQLVGGSAKNARLTAHWKTKPVTQSR